MPTPTTDPKVKNGKPHATTKDQIDEMENEGQAQNHESSPQADGAAADQEIDTAGTEADDLSATSDLSKQPANQELEIPGDTDSPDIVGRTGEQMPVQRHKGIKQGSHEVRH